MILMEQNYFRFFELKRKAKKHLKGTRANIDQLANAVNEIGYMRKEEVPELLWDDVQSIIKSCTKHSAIGEEGRIMASIRKMSPRERLALEKAIMAL